MSKLTSSVRHPAAWCSNIQVKWNTSNTHFWVEREFNIWHCILHYCISTICKRPEGKKGKAALLLGRACIQRQHMTFGCWNIIKACSVRVCKWADFPSLLTISLTSKHKQRAAVLSLVLKDELNVLINADNARSRLAAWLKVLRLYQICWYKVLLTVLFAKIQTSIHVSKSALFS